MVNHFRFKLYPKKAIILGDGRVCTQDVANVSQEFSNFDSYDYISTGSNDVDSLVGDAFSEVDSISDHNEASFYGYDDLDENRSDDFLNSFDYNPFDDDLFADLDENVNYDFGSIVSDNYGRQVLGVYRFSVF